MIGKRIKEPPVPRVGVNDNCIKLPLQETRTTEGGGSAELYLISPLARGYMPTELLTDEVQNIILT